MFFLRTSSERSQQSFFPLLCFYLHWKKGVSEKHIKVAHVEFFWNLLKFQIASSLWYFYKNYGKGSTLSMFSESFKKI